MNTDYTVPTASGAKGIMVKLSTTIRLSCPNQPFCRHALDHDLHFLFVCKPDSHLTLYQWVEAFAAAGKVETFSIRKWNGKFSELWTYRFLNQIPLRAGDDALPVNWCELHIRLSPKNDAQNPKKSERPKIPQPPRSKILPQNGRYPTEVQFPSQ